MGLLDLLFDTDNNKKNNDIKLKHLSIKDQDDEKDEKSNYDSWNFEEEELEEDDYYFEDDDNSNEEDEDSV